MSLTVTAAPLATVHGARVTVTWPDAPVGARMTIWRDTAPRMPVLGAVNVPAIGGSWDDPEVPLNTPIRWVVTATDGTTASSGLVTVTSDLPILSNPYTGEEVPVTISDWPEHEHESRATALTIEGDPQPMVFWDVESSATSAPILTTVDGSELSTIRRLFAPGGPLLLRASCAGVEDTWLQVTKGRKEQRVTMRAADWRRRHLLGGVVHLDSAPDPTTRPAGDTLADLHEVEPGTLADIAARWATLGDIAATDLKALL